MQNLLNTLRENIGTEEVLYFLGIFGVYLGCAAQYGHPIAQIVCGAILTGTALYLTGK